MDWLQRRSEISSAIALINAGNLDGAEARLRRMLSGAADDAEAMGLLAHIELCRDKPKAALETARAALQIDPDDDTARRVLTSALLRSGKYKEADTEASRLAEEDPRDSHTLLRLAAARFGLKDYAGGRDLVDEAEMHAEDNPSALLALASIRLDQWNYASAAELAQRALTLDPTQGEVFRILGECELAAKRPSEAYDLGIEALRLEPGDKYTLRLLARARARRHPLLKPFLPGIDWIVEMDRRGLVVTPLLLSVVFAAFAMTAYYDALWVIGGQTPSFLSPPLFLVFAYGFVSYVTAVLARWRIRRDLKKIALPKF